MRQTTRTTKGGNEMNNTTEKKYRPWTNDRRWILISEEDYTSLGVKRERFEMREENYQPKISKQVSAYQRWGTKISTTHEVPTKTCITVTTYGATDWQIIKINKMLEDCPELTARDLNAIAEVMKIAAAGFGAKCCDWDMKVESIDNESNRMGRDNRIEKHNETLTDNK